MKYQKVPGQLWIRPDFRAWGDDARLAALYLLTCPHRNTEGLYRLPLPLAAHDLGWAPDRMASAMAELGSAGFALVDPVTDLVWVPLALETDPPKGPKQIAGAVNALAELPESELRGSFLAACAGLCTALADALEDRLGWVIHSAEPDSCRRESVDESGTDTPRPVDSDDPGVPPGQQPADTPSIGYPDGIEGVPDTPSIPPSPSPSPSPSPHHHARSTQEEPANTLGGGGLGKLQEADEATAVVVATLDALGLVDPDPPTLGEIRTARRALDRGHTPDTLIALADRADQADRPRRWVAGAWAKIADPAPAPTRGPDADVVPIGTARPVALPRVHPPDCPGRCSDEGWTDGPDGLVRCDGQPAEVSA